MKILLTASLLSLLLSCSSDFHKSRRKRHESDNASSGQTLVPDIDHKNGTNDPPLTQARNTEDRGVGRILLEQWDDIPGGDIAALTNSPNFPAHPSSRTFLNTLETPKNTGDNYGRRIRGYLHISQPGTYVFYVAGDNQAQLFLSTTDKPEQLSPLPIAGISDSERTSLTEWEKFPGQTSAAIPLEAGKRYYFEVLNKEGTGNDGVAVGWKLPDGQLQRPIQGSHLSPFEVDPEYTAAIPAAADLFKTMTRGHPRLVGSALDFARLREKLTNDADIQKFFALIKGTAGRNPPPAIDLANRKRCDKETAGYRSAEQLLTLPACARILESDIWLLETSREVLRRVGVLAMAYQLTGEKKFADRAILEMRAVAEPTWGDWNANAHFLDTAELTHALALGYDWLYDVMSESDRALIVGAIKAKGLLPGIDQFQRKRFWVNTKGNWNVVCNSSLALGSLAIADIEPQLAAQVLSLALESTKASGSFLEFGPDGAYPEGLAYWGYAMKYLSAFVAGLESSLGTDFGLGKAPGLSEAGRFPMAAFGPNAKLFNYGDVGSSWKLEPSQEMHYLAQRFGRPEYAAYAKNQVSVYGLFWFNPEYANSVATGALDQYFRRVELAILRSGVSNNDAYVGIKSGDNKAGHSHLDLGSFVYDAKGVRWAMDPGAENYEAVGLDYFQPAFRWKYYRTRAEGQNTLVINPSTEPDQDPQAAAAIDIFKSTADTAIATTNLTPAYKASKAASVQRGFKLFKKSQALLIQDEIQTSQLSDIWWFMHIDVPATVSGSTAILTKGDKKLVARILAPAHAQFVLKDATSLATSPALPRRADSMNAGIKKLAVHLEGFSQGPLTILLTPLKSGEQEPTMFPQVTDLKDW